ncbi:MAG: family 20 glycosylhydrolase [Bryobacteraceae bacterium]
MRLPLVALAAVAACAETLPVRGIHIMAPRAQDMPVAVRFLSESLPKEGANLVVIEFNYRYQYRSRPEVIQEPSLSLDQVKQLVAACRRGGIRLVPQINLLGHQSWRNTIHGLLRAHPEFDETPNLSPDNQGIYCRSYCPLHPKVHEVVFDLVDELADACEAEAFHAGMDEVFLIGEDECPRCRGRNKAELFAGEVRAIHGHLANRNRTMWMWGDRLLDGETSGVGRWEASMNGTHPAVNRVPKDIVICDWHYEWPVPTASWFALHGFPVVSAPWRKTDVALGQLQLIRASRALPTEPLRARTLGVLQTTWGSFENFARAYYEEPGTDPRMVEAARCFRELFAALR